MNTNAKQHLPELFGEIVKNDIRRERLRDRFVNGTFTPEDWYELAGFVRNRKNLRRGAEQSLKWNNDKGSTA